MKGEQLEGKTFGRLTVVGRRGSINGRRVWDCVCACGNHVVVGTAHLKSGNTKSCGCLKIDVATERCAEMTKNNRKQETINNFGYRSIYTPTNETRNCRNRTLEHRLVVEESIGRHLTKEEVVHHLNGNKLDNRIENLVVLSRSEHQKLHIKEYWEKKKGEKR